MRGRKNNSGKICAELDLHMLTRAQAEIELYDFLERAYDLGFPKVLIITGKGTNSPDGESVLRPFVENLLRREKLKFKKAGVDRGGNGAFEVWL
ncbi:MAG: Smr/MutS family protein [Patescibacteria group bacterium]|nr:Smr/MutS family protein [Patescibacteria group bacterium]